ncbi:MAG: hypothetical protein IRY88_15705 [Rubrobacteraceae bacterium]|nr:hypothetical protein [Rubrobacteraceae bacterium]
MKLRRPALAAMAMVDFKVARRVRPSLGFALGAGELVLALALALGGPASRFIIAIAAALLWVFTLLIARSLWSGERFACFCFGDTDSVLSRWTLLRTSALALLASTLAILALPTNSYREPGAAPVLELVVAAAILGTVVLLGRVPDLWKWNRDLLERNAPGPEEAT